MEEVSMGFYLLKQILHNHQYKKKEDTIRQNMCVNFNNQKQLYKTIKHALYKIQRKTSDPNRKLSGQIETNPLDSTKNTI